MHFDWTISLGQLVTLAGLLISVGILYQKVLGRLDGQDAEIHEIKDWIKEHQKCNKDQVTILNEVRQVVAFVRGQMDHR